MSYDQLDEGKVSLKSVKHPEHTDNMSDETALKVYNHYDEHAAKLSGKLGMGRYSKHPHAFKAKDGQTRDHLFNLRQQIVKSHPHIFKENTQIGSNKMDYEQLDEFKADGENSSVADPTGVSAKKRKADKTDAGEPMQKVTPLRSDEVGGNLLSVSTTKMPARKADKSMKEEVKELFDDELSEEFLDKASTMFEAAVIERVNLEVEALEEQYSDALNEAVENMKQELSAKMDNYLDYVVEQWMNDNEVAIESGIKTEITESFFAGLKNLFAEHYVDVPEDKVDLAESLAFKVAELENELNSALTRNIELSNIIESKDIEDAFNDVTEGLTVSQKEKLATLAESLVFSSVDEYKSKLEVIKETFASGAKKLFSSSTAEETLNEEFISDDPKKSVDSSVNTQMEAYLSAVKKTIKR